jgi:uncharacterized membrane protein
VLVLNRFKNFISTVFIGGLLTILPIIILFKIFSWIFYWLINFLQPFTNLIVRLFGDKLFAAEIIAMTTLILGCFLIGIVVKTAWGKWLQRFTERWFLERIPGYSAIREIFNQFQPDNKEKFSRPVLITLDNGGSYFMGFITDTYGEDRYAVFIPTSPSPVNGFVVQTSSEHLQFIDAASDTVMRSVISCGVGSGKFSADLQR